MNKERGDEKVETGKEDGEFKETMRWRKVRKTEGGEKRSFGIKRQERVFFLSTLYTFDLSLLLSFSFSLPSFLFICI